MIITRLLSGLGAVYLAVADCECGFRIAQPNTDPDLFFAHGFETDFSQMRDLSRTFDWVRQEYNVTAQAGDGVYDKAFLLDNVASHSASASHGTPDSGIELRVGSTIVRNAIPAAELDTVGQDFFWGSYRAGLKLSQVSGTCAAWFWYFNDTQEIDMEFLSREFNVAEQAYPVNLVVQNKNAARSGYDASRSDSFAVVNLTFDPTKDFHEYGFDYLPGKVRFYADDQMLKEMEGSDMPSSSGHLILQHWSNGNSAWSGGPPAEEAAMTVRYVRAYHNSSQSYQDSELQKTCNGRASDEC